MNEQFNIDEASKEELRSIVEQLNGMVQSLRQQVANKAVEVAQHESQAALLSDRVQYLEQTLMEVGREQESSDA